MVAPSNPAGELDVRNSLTQTERVERIQTLQDSADKLKAVVSGLDDSQLSTKYINWTIRQIAFHLADSHINSYLRFLWTLTEEHPTIKPYNETKCAELAPARTGKIDVALNLFASIHEQWIILLKDLSDTDYQRAFFHPESQKDVTLDEALNYYAWHSQHHIAQIQWIRDQNGW